MSSRRHYGAIRKLPSGRYQARYRDGAGRLVPAPGTFATKGDAQRFLSRVEADQQRGTFIDPAGGRVTVSAWAEDWLRTKRGQRANTLARDRVALAYLLPDLGHLPLAAVTPLQIRSVVEAMRAAGRSPSTVRSYVATYASLFTAAVEAELIVRSPVRRKLLPIDTEVPRPRPHLSPPQLLRLADAVPSRYRALILVAGINGLRWSEAIGLRVRDVNGGRQRLSIVQTVEEVGGRAQVVCATKSDASRRTIALPGMVATAIAEHLAGHRPGASEDDLIFVGPRGGLLRRSFGRRVMQPAVVVSDLPASLTFHGLRHVAATYLEEVNAPLRVRQHRLGHAPQGVTLRTYTRVPEELDRAVADRLDALFAHVAWPNTHRARSRAGRANPASVTTGLRFEVGGKP